MADALETPFSRLPAAWRSPRTVMVDVSGASAPLRLPADARNVRVRLASSSAAHFSRVIDDLLEYPYGCVEQTASRMIPFALAIKSLGRDPHGVGDRLRQQLNGQRLRLAYMAGPKATFAWWGEAPRATRCSPPTPTTRTTSPCARWVSSCPRSTGAACSRCTPRAATSARPCSAR